VSDPIEILLVDDNPSDAELTQHVLSRHGFGVGIFHAHDGAEALDFLLATGAYAGRDPAQLPKMLLLDLYLPKADGFEVLRRVKDHPRTRAIPVVVLSSSWEARDQKRARELGAHSYVVKPVDFAQFVEAVRTALAAAKEHGSK